MRRALLLVALAPAACGPSSTVNDLGAPDRATPPDLAPPPPDLAIPLRDPKDHPPETAISYGGGRLLKSIDAVVVCWAGDALCPDRTDFVGWAVASEYWDLLAEYKIDRGAARGPYYLPNPPPAALDDSAVGPLLRAHIGAGDLPAPGPDTLYVLYLAPSTGSTAGNMTGCQDYGGYHEWTGSGVQSPPHVAYAIIPACDVSPTELDTDTAVTSHELAEAATDPEGSGWVDPSRPLSEIGDLCNPLDYDYSVAGRDWIVSRVWSAKTAAAGADDPCRPVPALPYVWFNAGIAPDPIEIVTDAYGNGETTIAVEPFAFGNVGKISWRFKMGPTRGVQFSTTSGFGNAGTTQLVTIKVTPLALTNVYPVWLEAHAGGYVNEWYGVIYVE